MSALWQGIYAQGYPPRQTAIADSHSRQERNMSWEENVRKVLPYIPGEQPQEKDIIKLNTNENPYPPAPGVERLLAGFDTDLLRLYPDPNSTKLTETLASYYGVKPSQIFVGVGSDDVLAMAFLTFFHGGKPILFPDITYSFYDVWANLYGIPYIQCSLDKDFRITAADYLKPNGGIIFPNPNAPTGVLESLSLIEEILSANRESVVIVDEAYIDFGGTSCLPLLAKYDNLLVVQTFSKSRSMAGLRIGFAIGSEKLIGYLQDAKFSFNSYTMNRTTQLLGVEAVSDDAYFKETAAKVIATRERVKRELKKLGFTFPDSYANFIFAAHKDCPGERLFKELRERKIYVRYWNKPRIDDYLRITIGTEEQMDILLSALREILSEK